MTLKAKKIIAREFLMLLMTVSMAFILYLVVYFYNSWYENKKEKISNKIVSKKEISDNLSKSQRTKAENQFRFAEKYYKENHNDGNPRNIVFYDEYGIPRRSKNWNLVLFERLQFLNIHDSLLSKWKNAEDFKDFGLTYNFSSALNLKQFIEDNIITNEDTLKSKQSTIIDVEIKSLQVEKENANEKTISFINEPNPILKLFLLAFSITFVFRYFYYAIRWSARILRQK